MDVIGGSGALLFCLERRVRKRGKSYSPVRGAYKGFPIGSHPFLIACKQPLRAKVLRVVGSLQVDAAVRVIGADAYERPPCFLCASLSLGSGLLAICGRERLLLCLRQLPRAYKHARCATH